MGRFFPISATALNKTCLNEHKNNFQKFAIGTFVFTAPHRFSPNNLHVRTIYVNSCVCVCALFNSYIYIYVLSGYTYRRILVAYVISRIYHAGTIPIHCLLQTICINYPSTCALGAGESHFG